MADFRYYLKDPESRKETQIRLHIHYNNQVAKIYIGEKILPDYWSSDRMRAMNTKKFPEYPEFNDRLEDAIQHAKRAMHALRKENDGLYPDPKILMKRVRIEIGLERGIAILDLFQYFDNRVREEEIRIQAEGTENGRGSYAKTIRRTGKLLKEFEKDNNYTIKYETIDLAFYFKFVDYMQTCKGYKPNTIGKYVKTVKHILKSSAADGLHQNMAYQHPKFKIIHEESDTIYLNEEDLSILENLDLKNQPGLDRARDLFLIGCWTGLRYSDYHKVKLSKVNNGIVYIQIQKTRRSIPIPLHPVVNKILLKYGDEGLSSPTNQRLNKALKDIGILIKKESKVKGINMETDKYNKITTHTARRSFATNMYNRRVIRIETIMAITGHKTQSEFYKYIRVTPEEHARVLRDIFNKEQSSLQKAN